MTSHQVQGQPVQLLTVDAAAERLSTSVRFVRRLIAERRIEFVKVGRHVRISESALAEFIDAGRIEPMTVAKAWPGNGMKGVA
jgi:excisionase family DNA binding protein